MGSMVELEKYKRIKNVWAFNFIEELSKIQDLIHKFSFVAMDTEFPGVVVKPIGDTADFVYQTIRLNVDLLKIIQLGITLADKDGNLAPGTSTWQFNFRFNRNKDLYAEDSIELLANSGINFENHAKFGIDPNVFAEHIISSGLILNDNIRWITFHSGYDFGYLLKILTCQNLPTEEKQFFELLSIYFPKLYDIKYLIRNFENFNGSLSKIAYELDIERIGQQHQAGSDSIITCETFFRIREIYFNDHIDESCLGILYGLGEGTTTHSNALFYSYLNHQNPLEPISSSLKFAGLVLS